MQIPTDEKKTPKGTLFERLATNRPWLAEELKKNDLLFLYASMLYAAEDAINLAFSFFSLGFAMNDAFHQHRDSASSFEFHDFEATPEGLAVTIAGSAFLFLFSSLGTYHADADPVKDGLLFYALGVFWSYLRDMLKAMKWAYKGMRSALLLVLTLSGHIDLLYHILFPITIVVGILAALNRVAIRYIRNRRKEMQKENEALTDDILATFHALTVMKSLPEEKELARYEHSLIALQTDEDYDLFYVEGTKEPNPYGYGTVTKRALKKLELGENKQQFKAELHQVQNTILCQQLSYLIPKPTERALHFVDSLSSIQPLIGNNDPELEDNPYFSSVVYLIDPAIPPKERVYVIDQSGNSKLDIHLSEQFEVYIQYHQKNNVLFGLPTKQLDHLLALNTVLSTVVPALKLGYTYEAWHKEYNDKKAKKQNELEALLCYILVAFSATSDGAYFYAGILFVAILQPHLFFAMLGMSAVLFMTYFLTKINEEYDYQRRFRRTQISVEIAKSEVECRFIEGTLNRPTLQKSDLDKLYSQTQNYETLYLQREKELHMSFLSALMLGFTCGLGFQGVISALMFLVIAVLTLTSTACPPALVFSFVSVGMACFLFSVVQFVVSYRQYDAKIKQQQYEAKSIDTAYFQHYFTELNKNGSLKLDNSVDIKKLTWQDAYAGLSGYPDLQKNLLLLVKQSIDRCAINPIQKFDLLGWWEVFRLLFSGIVKADKTYGELTIDRSDSARETWVMFSVAVAFSILMGVIFALRAIAKMFPVSSTKETPKAAPLQKISSPKVTEQSESEPNSRNHSPSKLQNGVNRCLSCGSIFHRSTSPSVSSKDSSESSPILTLG